MTAKKALQGQGSDGQTACATSAGHGVTKWQRDVDARTGPALLTVDEYAACSCACAAATPGLTALQGMPANAPATASSCAVAAVSLYMVVP